MTKLKPKTSQPMGILFVEAVPSRTKTNFKMACAKNNESMRDVLIDLMRKYAREHGIN